MGQSEEGRAHVDMHMQHMYAKLSKASPPPTTTITYPSLLAHAGAAPAARSQHCEGGRDFCHLLQGEAGWPYFHGVDEDD